MATKMLPETALAEIIILQFNTQYNKKFKPADFDLITLETDGHYDLAYEVVDKIGSTPFRAHVYLNYGKVNSITPFTLQVVENEYKAGLGDDIYVAHGTIKESIYAISSNTQVITVPSDEQGNALVDQDGFYIV